MAVETFGQRVRRLRIAKGMSQEGLGSCAGTTFAYISHIEADRRIPGVTLTEKLRRALGASTEELPGPWFGADLSLDEVRLLRSYRLLPSGALRDAVRHFVHSVSLYMDGKDGVEPPSVPAQGD